jgi:hypothetical protein
MRQLKDSALYYWKNENAQLYDTNLQMGIAFYKALNSLLTQHGIELEFDKQKDYSIED